MNIDLSDIEPGALAALDQHYCAARDDAWRYVDNTVRLLRITRGNLSLTAKGVQVAMMRAGWTTDYAVGLLSIVLTELARRVMEVSDDAPAHHS